MKCSRKFYGMQVSMTQQFEYFHWYLLVPDPSHTSYQPVSHLSNFSRSNNLFHASALIMRAYWQAKRKKKYFKTDKGRVISVTKNLWNFTGKMRAQRGNLPFRALEKKPVFAIYT